MYRTGNKWTENDTKTKWKRSTREIGRCVRRIQWNPKRLKRTFFVPYVCICALFVSLLSTDQNKDVFRLWMSAYVCMPACVCCWFVASCSTSCVLFASWFCCYKTETAPKKVLLTKCVFRFTSSGYDIVTWIWWEFLYPYLIGWKKGKRVRYTIWMLRHGPKRKTVSVRKRKSWNVHVDFADNQCAVCNTRAAKEQKLHRTHIKYSMLFAFAFRFLQSLHSLSKCTAQHSCIRMAKTNQTKSQIEPHRHTRVKYIR